MKETEQIEHFDRELGRLIERFRLEYSLSYAAAVGVLYLRLNHLAQESIEEGEE